MVESDDPDFRRDFVIKNLFRVPIFACNDVSNFSEAVIVKESINGCGLG